MENDIRRLVAKSSNEVMMDFIDKDPNDNEQYIYTGIVVNNNDPDKQGKVQVNVYNIYSEVPDKDLPWALPDFSFIGSKVGSFIVPPIGTMVNVYFDKGDIYFPHYTTKVVEKNSQPSQKDIDYPDNMVLYESDDGDYFTINRKSKITTFNHNSGTKIEIDKQGNVNILNKIGTTLKYEGNSFYVTPDAIKHGPFCALPYDTITGLPLQGNTVTRIS